MHVLPRRDRYTWNALWLADHALGRERVDGVAGGLRARVRQRLEAAFDHLPDGGFEPIERREGLDVDTFVREHILADRPVVLAGAAKGWPAASKWTFPWFADHYGDEPIQLMNASVDDDPTEPAGPERPLGDILRAALAGSKEYPRFVPLLQKFPGLLDDLDIPWLKAMRGPGLGLNLQLFMGGPSTDTALHCAMGSNLFVEVTGHKRWRIVSPAWTPALEVELTRSPYFFSRVDLEERDPQRWPWVGPVRGWIADLRGGDVLYVPPFFWHQVRNYEFTIGVGYRWYDPGACLRSSATMTALTLGATNPPIWTAAKLKGDFSKIFSGRWK